MSATLLLVLRIILVLLLYVFVSWVLWVMWRDLRKYSESFREQKVPQIGLYPQAEANLQPVTFKSSEINIGRDPACDYVLSDPTVSSRHARMVYLQEQWWVEDLNSTNGTYLNDQSLDQPTVITHGDRVQFGQIEFLVTIDLLQTTEVRRR
jgi:pSer/pThr/pTyr-binding forkhead associated (FHA) protein